MVTVILGILKVIGILLLVILGLLLFVLLCALFVPVRYRFQGQRSAEVPLQGQLVVSWLLHLFGITVDANGTGISLKLRLFGIPLDTLREFLNRRKKRKRAQAKKRAVASKKKATKNKKQESPELLQDKMQTEGIASAPKSKSTEKIQKKAEKPLTEKSPRQEETAKQSQKSKPENKEPGENSLLRFFRQVLRLPGRILKKIQQMLKNAENTKKSFDSVKAFIERQETRGALRLVWKKGIRLGRHVLPRRLKGFLSFGFSDPADTGYVLAILGALYPVYGDHIHVTPDFQQKKLEFSLQGSGRVCGIVVLVNGLQLFFDKNIQFILKNRKKEA